MSEIVDQGVIVAMRKIVVVLHANDFADSAPVRDLCRGDVAQADVTHQTLALKLDQGGERRLDRPFRGVMRVEHAAQVDDVEHIQA